MKFKIIILVIIVSLNSSCVIVSANRVFPKLTWYWSKDAKEQRREDKKNIP